VSVADALQAVDVIQQRIASIDPLATAPTGFAGRLAQAQTVLADVQVDAGGRAQTSLPTPAEAALVESAPTADASGTADTTPYDGMIVQAAQANGVDPALLKALVRQESGFDPNAQSGAGAVGLTQLMPGTASGLGVSDPRDPMQSLVGGARYLHDALAQFGGDEQLALAAYNAGSGAVERYGGIPPYPETQAYVPKVLGYAARYRAEGFGRSQPVAAAPAALGVQGAAIAATPDPTVQTALGVASQQLGTPYRWGGSSPATGFDCSGLVQYAYAQAGVQLPRVAADQFDVGTPVSRDQLQPGDIVFFQDPSGDVHHEGIYVGGGRFLHAPHTGDVVKISSLSEPYYAGQFAGGRRVA
jgi:cell wall-associated NlpC family hydrolase